MIKFIRGITVIFSFFVYGIGSLILGAIIFPIIHLIIKDKEKKLFLFSKIVYKTWDFFVHFLIFLRVADLNIKEIDKLKNIKQSVIVATHPSYIDVVILISLIPNTTCFAAKKLTKNIFMKNIVSSMFLTAAQPVEDMIKDAKYMLDIGFNVLIFPMGRRHGRNEYPKIHKGAAQIAIEANKDIVPVRISTDINFLQENEPVYYAGNKVVIYDIQALDTINIEDFKNKYTDEITLKKELTKEIAKQLYNTED